MASITLRAEKQSPLTNEEVDQNFINLNTDKLEGTVVIGNGGTGQTTKTAAFDALSPATTKGDLIAFDGTDNVRLGVGTNDYVLTADSTTATGLAWKAASDGGGITTGKAIAMAIVFG